VGSWKGIPVTNRAYLAASTLSRSRWGGQLMASIPGATVELLRIGGRADQLSFRVVRSIIQNASGLLGEPWFNPSD